jgi:hypothetical protein
MPKHPGVLCAAIMLSLLAPHTGAGSSTPASNVEAAFQRLYSFDFAGSRALSNAYIAGNSEDPMGHTARAASYLFAELNRLNALAGPISEDKVKGGSLEPDAATRAAFWKSVDEAQRLAQARLSSKPGDRDSLLAMAITSGLQRDYTALIDKKLRLSMDYIKAGQSWSNRLLAADPAAYDAYLNTGFSEYLIGSFPFFLKWVVKIDGVEGDKEKGFKLLEIAAKNGRYMKPFAQLLLANFYQKEGRKKDSERMLRSLLADHPDNETIRKELAKLTGGRG